MQMIYLELLAFNHKLGYLPDDGLDLAGQQLDVFGVVCESNEGMVFIFDIDGVGVDWRGDVFDRKNMMGLYFGDFGVPFAEGLLLETFILQDERT